MSKKIVLLSMMVLILAMTAVVPAAAEGEAPPEATATEEAAPTEESTEAPTEVAPTEAVETEAPVSSETPAPEETATETEVAEPTASETPVPEEIPTEEAVETTNLEASSLSVAPPQPGSILFVKKEAFGNLERLWEWDITKTADQSSITLSQGQSFQVDYTVTATATSLGGEWNVTGWVAFRNVSPATVLVTSVDDILSDGTVASVSCPFALPFSLPADWTSPQCSYSASGSGTAPASNTANVYISDGAGGSLLGGTVTVPVLYAAATEVDECADVIDSLAGFLGTVCAGMQTSFTFTYSRTIGPYEACGDFTVENVASFTTNDSGTSGSDGWTVDVSVPCAGGCSLTPGYWKTHSSYGPASYDDTWALVGEDTAFFSSGKTYYQALWTSPQGNAYWILAHAYIAAKLNQLNGADFTAAQAAYNSATALFGNPAYTPAYIGGLNGDSSLRQTFISLATILDNYNNGLIGPGHCSQ